MLSYSESTALGYEPESGKEGAIGTLVEQRVMSRTSRRGLAGSGRSRLLLACVVRPVNEGPDAVVPHAGICARRGRAISLVGLASFLDVAAGGANKTRTRCIECLAASHYWNRGLSLSG